MVNDTVLPAGTHQAVDLGKLQSCGGTDFDAKAAEAAILVFVDIFGGPLLLFAGKLGALHRDQLGRADTGAHFAGDAAMRFGLGIDAKLGIAPVSRGHLDLFPRVLDRDYGLEKVAEGDLHAGQEAPEPPHDVFNVTNHCLSTFRPRYPNHTSFMMKAVRSKLAKARGMRIFQAKVMS
jgi:hypothetical protein